MTQRNEPRREAVDLGKLLARCADGNRELAAAKGISIEVDAASVRDFDRPVLDPEQIGRALDNLVLNAIQNTPAGTNGRVRLGATRDSSHLNQRDRYRSRCPRALAGALLRPIRDRQGRRDRSRARDRA
jgi:signal transduction histidine kinase